MALALLAGTTVQAQVKPKPPAPAAPADRVRDITDAVLAELAETGNADAAKKRAEALFESLVAYSPISPQSDLTALRSAGTLRRVTAMLAEVPAARRKEAAALLRGSPRLREALAWSVTAKDTPEKVVAVLQRLAVDGPERAEEFANLSAAICVVFDEPVRRTVYKGGGEVERLKPPQPQAVFEYFTANEQRMQLGLKGLPVELLVHVVDLAEPKADWGWALEKYGKQRIFGHLYDDPRYDTDCLRRGTQKKWVPAGWSLENVLKHGGVCEDRALFAAGVAKANGVPAAYCSGTSSEMGHAWVGVLEVNGRNAKWNFTYGRFGDYDHLRGEVTDPQSGDKIADGTMSLLAESLVGDTTARRDAQVLTDAAAYLAGLRGTVFKPEKPEHGKPLVSARKAEMTAVLELLEAGLRRCPSYIEGWRLLASLGEDDRFDITAKKRWGTVLINLCGSRYPDFCLEILTPLVRSMPEEKERQAMWEWGARQFPGRADLVAQVRFAQAEDWENAGNKGRAWEAYQDVIARYLNAGPFSVRALARCEALLKGDGKEGEAVRLYADAWKRVERPGGSAPEFLWQSNWFRIGMGYARVLTAGGREREAADIMRTLGLE